MTLSKIRAIVKIWNQKVEDVRLESENRGGEIMAEVYLAHIRNEDPNCIQTVKEHSENTAKLCREYAIPEMKDFLYAIGLIHDIGKFQR